ncbi:uncharacterized protein TNCV_5022601 [Trichonephila clavipes]|nr:uncharacterized protein TNCV_5022601 [Trichonephila clavipes]
MEKRPHLKKKKVLFHQDSVLCHTLMKTMAKLRELGFELLPHPRYSPYLASSDFFLFSNLKRMLIGKKFSTDEENCFECHMLPTPDVAAVAEWYRHRIVAGFVTSSSPVPLKTRCVGQRCTLNLSRAEMSSRWCGVVVRRGGASSGVVHVT